MLRLRTSLACSFVVLAAACGSASSGGGDVPAQSSFPGGSTAGNVELAKNTQVLSQALADSVKVTPTQLTFPSGGEGLLSKKAGDILVSDRQAASGSGQNPNGFLRKVKSVSQTAEGVVVLTEAATLQESFQKLAFAAKITGPALSATGPVAQATHGALAPGLHTQGMGSPINIIDFSGKSIFDLNDTVAIDTVPPKMIDFHAFAKVNKGTLDFTPSWDLGADISGLSINGFHATGTGTLTAALELEAGIKTSTDLDSDSFTKLLAKKIFKSDSNVIANYPMDLGKISVGFISIPVSADFKATLACDFAYGGNVDVVAGANASASITAGVKYEGGKLSPVFDKSGMLMQVGPTWTTSGLVRIKCSITPEFSLKLYDLAAAEIWATGYASVSGSLSCSQATPPVATVAGEAYAGVKSGVHAKVDILGYHFEKSCTLFKLETDHAMFSQTVNLPTLGNKLSSCSGDVTQPPEPTPDPDACFATGGTGVIGGTMGCVNAGHDVPGEWTCDATRYGDCKCDCGCGTDDVDCDAGACATCAHDECTVGDPLGPQCSPCAKQMCDADPYCCGQYWGASCIEQMKTVCGKTCPLRRRTTMRTWRHLLVDRRGANMVEYILLVGVVALLSVTAFKYFSGKVWDKTTKQGEEVTHIGN